MTRAGQGSLMLGRPDDTMVRSATLSDDGRYRYRLSRTLGDGERMAWIMLNPSTADALVDDPTIRRCMGFARREGYDGIEVINLFAYRSPNPEDVYESAMAGINVVGPDNGAAWEAVLHDCGIGMVVAAWGADKTARVLRSPLYEWHTGGWFCLGTTASGAPRHPLYLKGDTEFVPWAASSPSAVSSEAQASADGPIGPNSGGES